ncbi:MAG: DUF4124 domain-containing protein [Gammaproteobacteria bacterium]|nr:DUF4124 domain-containing protein [Gammaproteobacteria bacterium]
MFKRLLIIIAVLIGIAFIIPSNPYTDKIVGPTKKSVKKTFNYLDDKVDLPDIDLPAETTTVHKWQDKDGNWHFTNTEPPKGADSKSKIYKDDVNVMPAPEIKTED